MAHVVLLRGVNVGGHRTFRPKQLAERLAHLDVVNLGAAGTFVVRAKVTQQRVRAAFEKCLPFATATMIVPGRDLLRLVAADPLAAVPVRKDIMRFVSVLARRPRKDPDFPVVYSADGTWQVQLLGREGRFVYGMYRRHMKAIGFLDEVTAVFGMPATTRNWNTIRKIAEVLAE